MGLFTRPTDRSESDSAATTLALDDERPELWLPDKLADEFERVAAEHRSKITPATDWYAELAGSNSISSRPNRGTLHWHLRNAFAATQYGGIIPGTVGKPHMTRYALEPYSTEEGRALQFGEFKAQPPTPEEREQLALYRWSEDHYEEFEGLVGATADEILADGARAWEAHVHITLIRMTEAAISQRAENEKRARDRDRMLRCPVCTELNGQVDVRPLLPRHDESMRFFPRRPSIKSCLPCWHTAVELHRATLAVLVDGRSRADVVAAHLEGEGK